MEYGLIFHVTRIGKYYCKNMKYRINIYMHFSFTYDMLKVPATKSCGGGGGGGTQRAKPLPCQISTKLESLILGLRKFIKSVHYTLRKISSSTITSKIKPVFPSTKLHTTFHQNLSIYFLSHPTN